MNIHVMQDALKVTNHVTLFAVGTGQHVSTMPDSLSARLQTSLQDSVALRQYSLYTSPDSHSHNLYLNDIFTKAAAYTYAKTLST